MAENHIKILNDIADRIESTPVTKENARSTLVDAGIITAKGNVRKPYREVFTRNKE